jgi:hypothetical protein
MRVFLLAFLPLLAPPPPLSLSFSVLFSSFFFLFSFFFFFLVSVRACPPLLIVYLSLFLQKHTTTAPARRSMAPAQCPPMMMVRCRNHYRMLAMID